MSDDLEYEKDCNIDESFEEDEDDYSDCKLPKLPNDCDATESDIY